MLFRSPVHHQLLEFTQTHIHQVGDAIQPSHPLSSPSPPAPNPTQNVLSTSKVEGTLKVRPFGYARDIIVNIGFLTNNN